MTARTPFPKEIDTVMAEVHRVKAALAKRYNYDLAWMFRDARARQAQSGHMIVDRSVKPKPVDK